MSYLIIPIMGLLVSLVSVFIGLGGGILLVPLLPEIFGLTVHEAVATSLLTILFVVSENTYRFHQQNLIAWPVVWLMGPTSAVLAAIAAQASQQVDEEIILLVLVFLLFLIAVRTLFASLLNKPYVPRESLEGKERGVALIGGGIAGLTSGFAGVGAGVMLGPIMIFLRAVRPEQLSPTANANMVFTTLAASLSFVASGHAVKWNQWGLVRWDIALGVFISAAFCGYFLRPHQNKLPFKMKSLILALLLLFLIYKILKRLNFLI